MGLTVANFVISGDQWSLMFLGFGLVGTFVAWKVPGHLTGRLMIGVSLVAAADALSVFGLKVDTGWIGAAMPLFLGLFILSFPSGRLPRGRWAPVIGMAYVFTIIGFFVSARTGDEGPYLAVPLGLFILGALADLILRYRKAGPAQKAQTRLVVFATILTPVVLVVSFLMTMSERWLGFWAVTSFMIVPAAVGVAIVRSRLYDIDRIISRTLAYTVVVGLLAAAYVAAVWITTSLIPAQDSLAVAASTLAVAAAFNPLRRRVQSVVDRRFNRSHYQAEIVADALAARLHESLTMEELAEELTRAVDQTLQPRMSTFWIANPSQLEA